MDGTVEVLVPMYQRQHCRLNIIDNSDLGPLPRNDYFPIARVAYSRGQESTAPVVTRGAADDFSCAFFLGTPPLLVEAIPDP